MSDGVYSDGVGSDGDGVGSDGDGDGDTDGDTDGDGDGDTDGDDTYDNPWNEADKSGRLSSPSPARWLGGDGELTHMLSDSVDGASAGAASTRSRVGCTWRSSCTNGLKPHGVGAGAAAVAVAIR